MAITIKLSHDKQIIKALRDEWIDLQNRSSATSIQLTWQWIDIWHKHNEDVGELWIMTAREDGYLIGIAPLIKIKVQPSRGFAWQELEFIGASDDHEHLDFIIQTGCEEQVIPSFIDELRKHRTRWDVITLFGIADTNAPDILKQSGDDWVEMPINNTVAPYTSLPDTMDEWMMSISSNHRQKLRRYHRKLDDQFPDQWSITQVVQPDELEYSLEHLVRLHQAFWEPKGKLGYFHRGELTGYYRELMHSMLENGWLRLYRLDIDDKPCAVDFCWHYRGRACYAIGGVDREVTSIPLGYILMQHTIGQAIREGLGEYSFMIGKQSWKYSFGGVNRVHQVFQLIESPRVRLQLKTVDLLRGVKASLRQIKSNIGKIVTDEVDEN